MSMAGSSKEQRYEGNGRVRHLQLACDDGKPAIAGDGSVGTPAKPCHSRAAMSWENGRNHPPALEVTQSMEEFVPATVTAFA